MSLLVQLLLGLGLVLVIEGAAYAFFPRQIKQLIAMVQEVPVETLRTGGIIAFAIGFAIVLAV